MSLPKPRPTGPWRGRRPDRSVATVDKAGTVHGLRPGTATVTATAEGKSGTCAVTVKAKAVNVTGVTLDVTELTLTEGEAETLTATVKPDNADNKKVAWSSDKTDVATVDGAGRVTAVKAGEAVVTVTTEDGGKTATCKVTVKAKAVGVTDVTLDRTELTLTEGETETLTATVRPDNADNRKVTWSSDKTEVATVGGDLQGDGEGQGGSGDRCGCQAVVCDDRRERHNQTYLHGRPVQCH